MKQIKIISLSIICTALLAGCINIPLGDGNKMKLSKDGLEFTDADGDKHSIGIDEDEESITMKGFGMDNNEGEGSLTLGGKELPEDFPEEIPLPSTYQIGHSMHSNTNMSVSFYTETGPEEMRQMYEGFFQTYGENVEDEVLGSQADNEIAYSYTGKTDLGLVTIGILPGYEDDSEKKGTTIMIEIGPNREEE